MEDLLTITNVTDLIRHKDVDVKINKAMTNISENMKAYLRTIENLKEEYSEAIARFRLLPTELQLSTLKLLGLLN